MAKILVYNNDTNRMLTFYKGLEEAMPYNSNRTLTYKVYDKYVIDPTDVSCTSQRTNGRKEVTLITCRNSGKQRLVVKATEVVE